MNIAELQKKLKEAKEYSEKVKAELYATLGKVTAYEELINEMNKETKAE